MSAALKDIDFPIACETCLGECASVRILRAANDKECKICQKPCSSFRWQPGPKARYKNTIICPACARAQNVCQVCLFDLKYGLPVQVRDQVARDCTTEEDMKKIARMAPYYRRNQARVCSFWLKGECTRGERCPFRHENDGHSRSGDVKKMRERYFGINDVEAPAPKISTEDDNKAEHPVPAREI